MKKQILSAAMVAALGGTVPFAAHAATLSAGNYLNIANATTSYNSSIGATVVTGGSWFGMDLNANSAISVTEKTALDMGTQGLVIGETQAAGGDCPNGVCSYAGAPLAGDTGNINAPWYFGGDTGKNYTTVAPTSTANGGINLSGWQVTWNGTADINMGGGAWQPVKGAGSGETYASGVANFTWDGTYGDSFTLNYTATVPSGGFTGVQYMLHLTGVVEQGTPVAQTPIPAAVWLFGSGLIGLVGVARRKKSA